MKGRSGSESSLLSFPNDFSLLIFNVKFTYYLYPHLPMINISQLFHQNLFSNEMEIPFLGLRMTSAKSGISDCCTLVLRLNFLRTDETKTFSSIIANLQQKKCCSLLDLKCKLLLLSNAVSWASGERNISVGTSLC